jgi:hypothetical protein
MRSRLRSIVSGRLRIFNTDEVARASAIYKMIRRDDLEPFLHGLKIAGQAVAQLYFYPLSSFTKFRRPVKEIALQRETR